MFTGIVTHTGIITSCEQRGDLRLGISCDWDDLTAGESVAVNGVCLTVTGCDKNKRRFFVDVSAETLACTAPRWREGESVHLERALAVGDRLSGHMVTGHVDGIARIVEITPEGDSHVIDIEAPAPLARFIAAKGSVGLDGVSLTVNRVEGARFWVNIIPHTWAATTFKTRRPGDALNLEVDILARYAERLLQK